jgi:hypothetical protein
VWRDSDGIIYYGSGLRAGLPRKGWIGPPFPQKMRSTTTLSTLCLVAWLDFGGSVRLKRPMRPLGGSVRLKRLMRPLGGSVRLKRLMRHKGRIGRCLCLFSGFGALKGCRVCVRTGSLKGTGFSPYINHANWDGL